jgi:hypothetical protein
VASSFLMGLMRLVWLLVFLSLFLLSLAFLVSSASLWRKRDMAVLNAGGTSTAAPSSALIGAELSSGSIFVCEASWASDLAISFVLLVFTIFDGMSIGSQVTDVKPKRHHLVMLGIFYHFQGSLSRQDLLTIIDC